MRVRVIECDLFINFAQKGTVRWYDFWNIFNKGLYGV